MTVEAPCATSRVWLPAGATEDVVRRSTGSYSTSVLDDGGPPLAGTCWVPRGPWTPVSRLERPSLFGPGVDAWRPALDVAVVRLGSAFPDAVRRAALTRDAVVRALEHLAEMCQSGEGLTFIGATANPPGLDVITVDGTFDPPRRTGLHLDRWDDHEPAQARRRNRLCINVGLEARHLLFIPRAIAGSGRASPHAGRSPAADFLASHPEEPVLRVRIAPGEGYIAPTENLIHDATTSGMTSEDRILTFLGHFFPGGASLLSADPQAAPLKDVAIR